MKKTIFLGLLPLIFTLISCSSSSNDRISDINETNETVIENPEDNNTIETKNLVIPSCENGEVLVLLSGDKVLKISENPQVEITHNQDNLKTICLKSGEAEVERAE